MVTRLPVIIISNDVVPGLTLPVAAPGLRAYGLAEGLRAHDIDARVVVVRHVVDRLWKKDVPPPTPRGTELVSGSELRTYLTSHAPAIVVLTNSNQIDHVEGVEGLKVVVDLFAPKMLELVCQEGTDALPIDQMQSLRERKIRALARADGFIVNGAKKIPYFLGWLLQADRDPRTTSLPVVNMCVPLSRAGDEERGRRKPVRLALTGYVQGWSRPGPWMEEIERHLDPDRLVLDLVVGEHWGNAGEGLPDSLLALREHPAVTLHPVMAYEDFVTFLAGVDVSIDLFTRTLEREYAMITRSIVALACGVPVVHPRFTEVTPLIARYDAGWLVDPGDAVGLSTVLDELVEAPDELRRKAENARRLAQRVIQPARAVAPLVELVDTLSS